MDKNNKKQRYSEKFSKKFSEKFTLVSCDYGSNNDYITVQCNESKDCYSIHPYQLFQWKKCNLCKKHCQFNSVCISVEEDTILNKEKKLQIINKKYIDKCKKKYGDKYSYDHCKYIDCHTDVIITCRELIM